jgi:endoglucanase
MDGAPQPAGLPVTDPVTYLREASNWADAYMSGHYADLDSFNLFDVSALAHRELFHAVDRAAAAHLEMPRFPTRQTDLTRDVHDQLAIAARRFSQDPFGFASPNGWGDSTTHALGLSLAARFYAEMAPRDHSFAALGAAQADWLLGANGWGTSFVVGAGTTFPHCLQHQVANLAYSLDGRGRVLRGAVVNGPNVTGAFAGSGAPDGYRACPRGGGNPFARFDGRGAGYRDSVLSSASSEPTTEAAALAVAAFARAGG